MSNGFGWRCLGMGFLAAVVGCSRPEEPAPAAPTASVAQQKGLAVDDALVQFSLISALASGDYSDGAPLSQVLAGGDFGIGTFDRLDGELIVLEGKIYQALADGAVRSADMAGSTPFAAVTFFNEDGRIENLTAATLEDLDAQLDRQLPRANSPYAIRIDADLRELTLRSVPSQVPPFPPLVEVVKQQSTWKRNNVRGTLIGFRCPTWVGTLNVSGYHWHFLSEDRQFGGHVLGCEFRDGLTRYDECESVLIQIPRSKGFDAFRPDEIKKQDINVIERQRAQTERP